MGCHMECLMGCLMEDHTATFNCKLAVHVDTQKANPRHEKTNVLVSDLVKLRLGYTITEDV